jgi:hypothetical protein
MTEEPTGGDATVETVEQLVADLLGLEDDVRARQHSVSHLDGRWKRSGRTDLMPGRHYAIALTAMEEARLRLQEAGRLEHAQR